MKFQIKLAIATFKFNINQDTNDLNTKIEILSAWFEPCCLPGEILIHELLYMNHVVFLIDSNSNEQHASMRSWKIQ